jgi:hypothetical protein
MAGGERDELNAAAKEQWIGAEHECAGLLLPEGHEDGIDLAAIACVEHLDLLSHRRCRYPHLGCGCICKWIVRIEQQPDEFGSRQQLPDQPEPLFPQPAAEKMKLVTRPAFCGSFSLPKTMGMVVVAALAATVATEPAGVAITLTRRRTNSAASAGSRSNCSSAQWYSTVTFCPSSLDLPRP